MGVGGFKKWVLKGLFFTGLCTLTLWAKSGGSLLDPLLYIVGGVLGGFVTLIVFLTEWAARSTLRRSEKFHDADPDWHYLTLSGLTAAGYTFGVLFALALAALGVLLAVYGPMPSVGGFGLAIFFVGLAALNVPMMLFGWFSEWRWNDDVLQRRNPLVGLREDRFGDVVAAGVWPVSGLIGIRFRDGHVARISQEVPGAFGLYGRLRRELRNRFWGGSFQMENELAEIGLNKYGEPLDQAE